MIEATQDPKRLARDAALEEAALLCEELGRVLRYATATPNEYAAAIRALKTSEPGDQHG